MFKRKYTVHAEVPNPEDAPPGAPVEQEEEPTIDEDINLWDSLSADIDEEDDFVDSEMEQEEAPPVVEPEPEPEPEPPVELEPEPEAEPVAELEPEVPEVPEEPDPPAEQPPTEDTAPEPVPPPTEEQVAATRADLENRLESRFAISDEEALQMVTEPGKVFPKLQARMFADMWTHMTTMMRDHLPEAIEQNVRTMASRDEKVDSFFSAWPKLNKGTHGKAVSQVAKLYAGVNPKASEADIIKYVGMQVMMMHNLTPDQTSGAPVDIPAEIPVAPFKPASVNSGRAPLQQSDNVWSSMAEELLDDDESY